jgi:hypothetical protein
VYASDTSIPVERSQAEIEKLLRSHGAEKFMRGEDGNREVIACWLNARQLMFELPLPDPAKFKSQERQAKRRRSCWRALLLCIKAKFVSVESGVESFEDAFLAQIVVPTEDGRSSRMGRVAAQHIALAYEKGAVPNFGFAGLLPEGGK